MNLSNLKKLKGTKDKKTKVGRGYASGHGGHTSTRGQKGQKSRTGTRIPWFFEGGQLPLVKRLPHLSGFNNFNRANTVIIKTSVIDTLNLKNKIITPEVLIANKIINKSKDNTYKFIFNKKVTTAVNLKGFKYTKTALDSIEKAGGKAN